jgi:hypothetical protein
MTCPFFSADCSRNFSIQVCERVYLAIVVITAAEMWEALFAFHISTAQRLADPMLMAQVRSLHPRLMLLQDPDDLLFRLPAFLHLSPPVRITREPQL